MSTGEMGTIIGVFTDEIVQMLLAEDQEIVQALLLDTLDHSFAPGIQVRALYPQDLDLHPFSFEHVVELCRELRVAIANQADRLVVAIRGVHPKIPCLLCHPSRIGMCRGIADEDLAGLNVDDDQQEIVDDFPRRDDALCEKVAGPERLGVDLDELFPRTLGPFRRGIDPFLFEDVADRLPADAVDAQSPQLAQDAGVTDTGFAGDLTDQLTQYLSFSGPSRLGRLVAAPPFPDPTMESCWA